MKKFLLYIVLLITFNNYGQNKKTLDDKVYKKIKILSQKGDLYSENGDYKKAIKIYWKAYELIPSPKTEWESSLWLLVAIGDANFLSKDFKSGVEIFLKTIKFPNGFGNPFLHLRLGQCQYEIGNLEKAADELTRAFGIEGKKIFESEDPKYYKFLKTKITIK